MKQAGIPEVQIIIVDEFQSKKPWDYYQQDREPTFLEDIYESITRARAGEVKMIGLGNSVTILNPYFVYLCIMDITSLRMKKLKKEWDYRLLLFRQRGR